MRAVGYVRVSTEGQAERGVSLAAQEAKLRALAALHDAEIVEMIRDEGASAKTLNRPGMARVLELVRSRKVDAVFVAKLDRVTRSVRDLADLVETFRKRGVALVSAAESLDTSTAAGRMVINLLATVAQWEREAVGERTSDALRHKQAIGEFIGGAAPYGFALATDGASLVPVAAEQAVLEQARELRAAGLSLRKVAARLTECGKVARNGRPFAAEQVRRLISSSTVAIA